MSDGNVLQKDELKKSERTCASKGHGQLRKWARGGADRTFKKFDAVKARNTTLSGARRQGYRKVTQSCYS